MTTKLVTTTKLYFSGDWNVPGMTERLKEFINCGVMITFYDLPQNNPEKAIRSMRRMIKQKRKEGK